MADRTNQFGLPSQIYRSMFDEIPRSLDNASHSAGTSVSSACAALEACSSSYFTFARAAAQTLHCFDVPTASDRFCNGGDTAAGTLGDGPGRASAD